MLFAPTPPIRVAKARTAIRHTNYSLSCLHKIIPSDVTSS